MWSFQVEFPTYQLVLARPPQLLASLTQLLLMRKGLRPLASMKPKILSERFQLVGICPPLALLALLVVPLERISALP